MAVLIFSAGTLWAQNNAPVRLTVSGLEGFINWSAELILSTSNNIDNWDAYVAYAEVDNINTGTVIFALLDEDDDSIFTRSGRYYIFLEFWNDEKDRAFVTYNMQYIMGGPQHFVFTRDLFQEIDFD